ncbi:hypothetical protein FPV67DRAFT_1680714 [Lyophyllum atratum]|nr:hypothetical protein FPV67DRAFT_1680714 [Lyophyllum atratum]
MVLQGTEERSIHGASLSTNLRVVESTSKGTAKSIANTSVKLEVLKQHLKHEDGTDNKGLLATIAVAKTGKTSTSADASSSSLSHIMPKDLYAQRSVSLKKRKHPYTHNVAGSYHHHAINIALEASPKPEPDEMQAPHLDLHRFLANLEHDMSGIMEALIGQDLGTSEKLFALAEWPEDDLHRLFKEAVPQLTVAQRFMLVRGMKKTVEE